MKNILIGIDKLVEEEYGRANKKFPLFASDHEGYAVIQEEIDEVKDDNQEAMHYKEQLWRAIKADEPEVSRTAVEKMKTCLQYAAAEKIQAIAMCDKFIASQKARGMK